MASDSIIVEQLTKTYQVSEREADSARRCADFLKENTRM